MQSTRLPLPKHYVKLALRFAVVCTLTVLTLLLMGPHVLSILSPLFKWEIGWIAPYFKIVSFGIGQHAGSSVFLLSVSIDKLIILNGQFVLPNEAGIANASTVTSYVWQITVLYAAVILAWPFTHQRELWIRIVLGLHILVFLLMLDTPLALLGAIWGLIYQAYAPDKVSLLMEWNHFMMGGGRLMLGVVAGLLTVHAATLLSPKNVLR